jgi:hypothetical protein
MFRITAKPLGFEPANLTVATVRSTRKPYNPPPSTGDRPVVFGDVPGPGSRASTFKPTSREDLMRRITDDNTSQTEGPLRALAALDGVGAVAAVSYAPFVDSPAGLRVRPDGTLADSDVLVSALTVTDAYFRSLGVDFLRGRPFTWRDGYGVRNAIVSRELERRVFAGDALGKRLRRSGTDSVYDVVGVVENAKHREFIEDDKAVVYFAFQGQAALPHFLIRSTGDTSLSTIANAVRAASPQLVVTASRPMDALVARTVAEPLFRARLATAFGMFALLLAAIGLYGLASRAVADRRREIGVRVAMGARPVDVRRLFLRDAFRTVLIGLLLGLPAAYAVAQLTQTFLYGVSPDAPHVFAIAAAVLAIAAVLATLLPARRAAKMDPMIVLKD